VQEWWGDRSGIRYPPNVFRDGDELIHLPRLPGVLMAQAPQGEFTIDCDRSAVIRPVPATAAINQSASANYGSPIIALRSSALASLLLLALAAGPASDDRRSSISTVGGDSAIRRRPRPWAESRHAPERNGSSIPGCHGDRACSYRAT
jgi:hypothetical protein